MTSIQDSAVTGLVLLARAVYNVNYNTDFHKLTIVPPSTAITTGCKARLGGQIAKSNQWLWKTKKLKSYIGRKGG